MQTKLLKLSRNGCGNVRSDEIDYRISDIFRYLLYTYLKISPYNRITHTNSYFLNVPVGKLNCLNTKINHRPTKKTIRIRPCVLIASVASSPSMNSRCISSRAIPTVGKVVGQRRQA